ncbi:amidase signature domain-containing protein [Tricladium varicosporioides]|nr:amidase signature domain-containing protein [Hymenoscyphus varicosporioides]
MPLKLFEAVPEDADRIAAIHLAAFDSNPLLHAQFPTPASLASLRHILVQDTLYNIENAQAGAKAVLVIRDTHSDNQIISFAKWDLPGASQGLPIDVTWHEDVNQDFLTRYQEFAEAAKQRVIGNKKCFCMTFLGTDPNHQGRGAASLLIQWGIERAEENKVPIYLDSTLDAAPLYRRHGFVALDGLALAIPNDEKGQPIFYQELSMLRSFVPEDVLEGMDRWDSSLNISSLRMDYDAGIKPQHVIEAIYERIEAYKEIQPSVWINLQPIGEVMKCANLLHQRWPDPNKRPPLWGIPFSVKDSINVAGVPTTIGCPALAFTPTESALVLQQCIDAGALFIGKVNMEQLATGMTGCCSPYGTLHSTFSKLHIVGGSSSGSAVSVSEGLVSFSLGSDTTGSIRVPALYNGVVGFKPTKGTVSANGVYPACQHQDCVSFLATTTEDAEAIWDVCKGFDKSDPFARQLKFLDTAPQINTMSFRFGTPPGEALDACSLKYRERFDNVIGALKTVQSSKMVDLDWAPFSAGNELLYSRSFVLERLTILPDGWFEANKQLLHPVIRKVFDNALSRNSSAVDLFRDLHKQAEYKRAVEEILTFSHSVSTGSGVLTVMVVPTAPFHPTIEEAEQNPLSINEQLGSFTHFANVLDLVAIAIPCGTYEVYDEFGGRKKELPFGITILAGCGYDRQLLMLAKELEDMLRDL